MKENIFLFLARFVAPFLIRLLIGSLTIEIQKCEALPERNFLFAFWHGKMLLGWLLPKKLLKNFNGTFHAVTSQSKDGSYLAAILQGFGYRMIRGSSSKGKEAVRSGVTNALHSGEGVSVTPDGPRGPIYQFKYGTVRLAAETETPLVFARITFSDAWQLRSWDKFEIPKPFSKAHVSFEVFRVPQFASDADLQVYSRKLSEAMQPE
jgi:lysophospholipid acyltransferase (LPLAT)-like uncharacterized protein